MKTAINSFKQKNSAKTSLAAKADELNLSSDENEASTKQTAPAKAKKTRSSIKIKKIK